MRRFLLHSRAGLLGVVLLQAIYSAGFVGFALVIQQVVNVAMAGVLEPFLWWVAFSAGYLAVFAAVMFAKNAASARYVYAGVRKLRDALTERLLKMRYEDFTKNDSSKYLSTLTNDITNITQNYFTAAVSVPEEVLSFVFAVAASFFINYIVALTMIGLTFLVLLVPLVFNRPLNKANLKLSEDLKQLTHILKQTFLGIDVVKNFSSEQRIGGMAAACNARQCKSAERSARLNAFAMCLGITIVVILQLVTVAVSGALLIRGVLLVGAVFAAVQLGNNLFTPVMNVSGKLTQISGVRDLNAAVLDILRTPAERTRGGETAFERALTVNGVTYRYGGEEQDTLRGVSAQFCRGGKYLVVGRSGSGKSTLLKLLAKMYQGYEGQILLDSTDYASLSGPDLYKILAVAQQRSYLFRMTVRENIDFNGTGDTARLNEAVRLACLEQFVAEQGLDTVIDEEVNQISGGEKLRIGLARALFRSPDVLLLDEVTSALDGETAHTVEENLLGLAGKTVINVSHRLQPDLLRRYDGILILEEGKVADSGTPEAVLAGEAFRKYLAESESAAR